MKESLVMTVIGTDRPGLVEALSAIIEAHGGNWEESRMTRLAGQFAGLVHVHAPAERAGDLERALGEVVGLRVVVARAPGEEPAGDTHVLELEVHGQDHPGIVHQLSEAIAAREISIEKLESEVSSAPMTGQKMFQARARLRAPKRVGLDDLTDALEAIAADLMVEVRLAEPAVRS